jgi:hypothetical protein
VPPEADIVTVVVPLTVAPAVGAMTAAPSGAGAGAGAGAGGAAPLTTLTDTPPAPVLPVASRTLAVSSCTPSPDSVLSYGSEIGPALLLVVEPTARPPSVSVTLFAVPRAPLIQTTAHALPLTVVPAVGCVIATVSVPPGAGGGAGAGVAAFDTVTVRVAVAVAAAASRTVSVSVCAAFVVAVVFQL